MKKMVVKDFFGPQARGTSIHIQMMRKVRRKREREKRKRENKPKLLTKTQT